jgi:lysozyme family protein
MKALTEDQLVEDTFDKEGREYGDEHTNPPIDQPTAPGGIILATLSEYLGRPATLAELRALTVETSRPIVRWKLRQIALAHGFMGIGYEPLRMQMIDWSYNSGPGIAIRWLQRILRVDADGRMGPATNAALDGADPWLVHHALIGARFQMIDMWTDAVKKRKQWEEGLENRVLSFSMLLDGQQA